MSLYLDMDGCIIGKAAPSSAQVVLARPARPFLEFALAHFDVFWLTTHCKGDCGPILDYLRPLVPDDVVPLLDRIKPTNFDVLKAEGLQGDLFWIDDSPLMVQLTW